MTQQQQKTLMYDIFGGMMMGGYFHNQHKMVSVLKAIYHLLGTQEKLTPQECDNCLLYFFQEYAKGCNQPISDSYIRSNMIPIVKEYQNMDLALGVSILMAAKIK
jgi:hypothetical protein